MGPGRAVSASASSSADDIARAGRPSPRARANNARDRALCSSRQQSRRSEQIKRLAAAVAVRTRDGDDRSRSRFHGRARIARERGRARVAPPRGRGRARARRPKTRARVHRVVILRDDDGRDVRRVGRGGGGARRRRRARRVVRRARRDRKRSLRAPARRQRSRERLRSEPRHRGARPDVHPSVRPSSISLSSRERGLGLWRASRRGRDATRPLSPSPPRRFDRSSTSVPVRPSSPPRPRRLAHPSSVVRPSRRVASQASEPVLCLPLEMGICDYQARSISHWSPYDRVRVVNAVP